MKTGFRHAANNHVNKQARWRVAAMLVRVAIALAASPGHAAAETVPAGDAARGATLYQGCEDCHSIGENDVGPMHRGVVGRVAGGVPDYHYSAALKESKIVWTEDNLDKWLANPLALVPGSKMRFKVNDAQDRADIIAFLKERAK
jgi:cytochrome c